MNIAILGYGVVGAGVHSIAASKNLGIDVVRVLDLRQIAEIAPLLTTQIDDILCDPSIDCIVETMGGLQSALLFVTRALRAGKHVVTSNKELISHGLVPLLIGAQNNGVQLRFSASVGGGIPWLPTLLRQKRADTLLSVKGIVNGTTNYILDAMHHGASFSQALVSAQRLGYAEADATDDLIGNDAKRKCAISASLAFDTLVETSQIPTLGIAGIQPCDIEAFQAHQLTCKLMMYAERFDGHVCAYVEPMLLTADEIAAHTPTNHNCISLCGEHTGHLTLVGQGAGRFPTAENVIQDVLDIQQGLAGPFYLQNTLPVQNDQEIHAYYIRTSAKELLEGRISASFGAGVCTRPMRVTTLHALAGRILQEDPDAFFAAMPPEETAGHTSR